MLSTILEGLSERSKRLFVAFLGASLHTYCHQGLSRDIKMHAAKRDNKIVEGFYHMVLIRPEGQVITIAGPTRELMVDYISSTLGVERALEVDYLDSEHFDPNTDGYPV